MKWSVGTRVERLDSETWPSYTQQKLIGKIVGHTPHEVVVLWDGIPEPASFSFGFAHLALKELPPLPEVPAVHWTSVLRREETEEVEGALADLNAKKKAELAATANNQTVKPPQISAPPEDPAIVEMRSSLRTMHDQIQKLNDLTQKVNDLSAALD